MNPMKLGPSGQTTPATILSEILVSDGGASVVETALSAMILLVFIFGILETSMALYAYHFTSESAREATRYAMVRGSSCTITGCPIQAPDVQTYTRGLVYPGIDPSRILVTTTWPTTGPACTPSSNPCNNPGNVVVVTVQYQFFWSIPFVPPALLNLSSSSAMVISQ